jgi:iron(III) transport system permease protein
VLTAIRREPAVALLAFGAAAGIAFALVYPLSQVLIEAVLGEAGLDVSPLVRVITQPVPQRVIVGTLVLGVTTATLSTLLGFAVALTTARATRGALRAVLHYAALLPLIAPPFALALSTIFLFGRQGMITKGLLGLELTPYGFGGLVFVQTITFFPVAYIMFDALLRQLDPALEEAAYNLGASRGRILRTVTIPLLRPGFAGAFLIVFVEALADLGNPLIIGGDYDVLASSTYLAVVGEFDTRKAVAFAVALMAPSVIAYFAQQRWVGDRSVVTVTGRPSTGTARTLETGVRLSLIALSLIVAALILLLYVMIFVGAFTKLLGIDNSVTLENYRYVFNIGGEAMSDTTLLSAVAAPIASITGLLLAYLVIRTRLRGRSAFDYVTMLGAAAPGIVLGLGILLAFNHPPLALSGTAVVFIIAFVVRTAPVALRASIAALMQIDPSIEHASANLGAGATYTFRRVTLPLVTAAVVSSTLFSFARNMTTLSTIALLVTPEWRIMTSQILNEIEAQRLGSGAAYSTILIVTVFISIVVLQRLFRGPRAATEVAT